MVTAFQELQMYKNFDELSSDVLDLAKEILPDQLLYLTSVSDTQQMILKLSNNDTNILITEGLVIDLNETVCNRIDFDQNQPLIYEDMRKESSLDNLRDALEEFHIRSYLGIPISLVNGERFGTLCAVNDEESHFDEKSVDLLQRIVRMFSYYLYLERFAYRDSLTELYNRRYLTNFFENASKSSGTLLFLDLDGFKQVNDLYGHDTGDLVLQEVALRLQKFAAEHPNAFVVRLGGDEFVVHLSGISSEEELSKQAKQILTNLSTWDGKYRLSASMGIVTYPDHYTGDIKMLLKDADQALYQAKTSGKNKYMFFDECSK